MERFGMISVLNALRTSSPRIELKGVAEGPAADVIEMRVRLHPALFIEEYQERRVNNVYLDTHDFQLADANVVGSADRIKIRVRWYGALIGPVAAPVLEFKRKVGEVGFKIGFPVAPCDLPPTFDGELLLESLRHLEGHEDAMVELRALRPTLINTYRRRYYRTADRKYRLTIDSAIQSYPIGLPRAGSVLSPRIHSHLVN